MLDRNLRLLGEDFKRPIRDGVRARITGFESQDSLPSYKRVEVCGLVFDPKKGQKNPKKVFCSLLEYFLSTQAFHSNCRSIHHLESTGLTRNGLSLRLLCVLQLTTLKLLQFGFFLCYCLLLIEFIYSFRSTISNRDTSLMQGQSRPVLQVQLIDSDEYFFTLMIQSLSTLNIVILS